MKFPTLQVATHVVKFHCSKFSCTKNVNPKTVMTLARFREMLGQIQLHLHLTVSLEAQQFALLTVMYTPGSTNMIGWMKNGPGLKMFNGKYFNQL